MYGSIEVLLSFIFCLVCMCYYLMEDEGVARELLSEVRSAAISRSSCGRI